MLVGAGHKPKRWHTIVGTCWVVLKRALHAIRTASLLHQNKLVNDKSLNLSQHIDKQWIRKTMTLERERGRYIDFSPLQALEREI